MSEQMRPSTARVQVCDLCGEPVDTYGHRDWSALNIGHAPIGSGQKDAVKKAFVFWRKRHGDRASGAPERDYREWRWDFHGECLVKALMPLVTDEARSDAGVIGQEGESRG
ncbi:hypothetical protein [Microbacterium paraoxydans]|uniref:HNH endonuclease n=1 Tax=Microbacterium paraoxydans TaxID=199592 RepID=A0ABS5IME0_9MICO|nr:hypothetical protein [Microbacterium paraoxydans]MBS0024121.1 hypothetical protein [Microbacterium paraoxydans]